MDGIQPFAGPPRPSAQPPQGLGGYPAAPPVPPPPLATTYAEAANPAAVKAPADYLKALRRRTWLVLAVAVPLGVLASVYAVRQPSVYRASAQVLIVPPRFDATLAALVGHDVGRSDPEAAEKYSPNKVALLKSKWLAEKVVADPAFQHGNAPIDIDAAAEELVANLAVKPSATTNYVAVTLEGADPAKAAHQLTTLVDILAKVAKDEVVDKDYASQSNARDNVGQLNVELAKLDGEIADKLRTSRTIGPGGINLLQSQYLSGESSLAQKKMRVEDYQNQSWAGQFFTKPQFDPDEAEREAAVRELKRDQKVLAGKLDAARVRIRNYQTDPSYVNNLAKLRAVQKELDELRAAPRAAAADPAEALAANYRRDVDAGEAAQGVLLKDLRESMPEHQKFLSMLAAREDMARRIGEMERKLATIDMLSKTQDQPIKLAAPVAEPTVPVRPRRALNVGGGLAFSLALGVMLVCLLEYLDHSVKVPEHLSVGLGLPLLGVVPRIRRTAATQRGGHLWCPGAAGSVAADAYRNVRAGLLGAADRLGPITTLLVTSAKAGEGKSTTALNLAATCARAGERVLLMDVDLRRPSLGEVFRDDDDQGLRLVDVLRGAVPWQRTVVRTEMPNLDFLPAGDTRDVPIEVLGTLELRQLLVGLAGHYDRVILDGPAVLGLADCRMLGRVVDAAVLVVRSGAHEMRPLQRAKAVLEQSRVVLGGVIFNGLAEDYESWSSYGPSPVDDGRSEFHGLDAPDPRFEDAEGVEAAGAVVAGPGRE